MEEKIILKAENGDDVSFDLIASLKVENTDYAILHDIENDEDLIFKVLGDEEKEFILITAEDEIKLVSDAYYEL